MAEADLLRTGRTILGLVSPAVVEVDGRGQPFPVLRPIFERYISVWNFLLRMEFEPVGPVLEGPRARCLVKETSSCGPGGPLRCGQPGMECEVWDGEGRELGRNQAVQRVSGTFAFLLRNGFPVRRGVRGGPGGSTHPGRPTLARSFVATAFAVGGNNSCDYVEFP